MKETLRQQFTTERMLQSLETGIAGLLQEKAALDHALAEALRQQYSPPPASADFISFSAAEKRHYAR